MNTPTPAGTPVIWTTLEALPTSTPAVITEQGFGETPCSWVTTVGNGAQLQCRDDAGNVWVLNVDIAVPCPVNTVIREPYPRLLVNQEVRYGLLPQEWNPSEGGEWSPPQNVYSLVGKVDADGNPLLPGLVRNVKFGLRAQRLSKATSWLGASVPGTHWLIGSSSSDGDPRAQEGMTATFSYAAASYFGPNAANGAQPNRGRTFDFINKVPGNSYSLPAYPVQITTYCGFWHSITLEESEAYWHPLSSCFPAPRDLNGVIQVPANHSTEGCPAGQISFGETRHRWKPKTLQPWTPIDMRRFGVPTPYVPYRRATSGGIFKGQVYMEPPMGGVWQPVVEVQTVQQDQ